MDLFIGNDSVAILKESSEIPMEIFMDTITGSGICLETMYLEGRERGGHANKTTSLGGNC